MVSESEMTAIIITRKATGYVAETDSGHVLTTTQLFQLWILLGDALLKRPNLVLRARAIVAKARDAGLNIATGKLETDQ